MMRPTLQRPTYLDGAPAADALPALKSAAADACDACKRNLPRGGGLISATLLGVTAAYFAPKLFDWALSAWHDRDGPADDELEFEVER